MSASNSVSSVAELARNAADWWIKELASLLPARFWQWLTDAGGRSLVIAATGPKICLRLCDDRKRMLDEKAIKRSSDLANEFKAFLKSHHLRPSEAQLGLSLPIEAFFCREILLPREVGRLFPDIARKDLLHNTPFREEDIYYDYAAEHSGPHIIIRQYVIRRAFVNEAVLDLGMELSDITFVESGAEDDDLEPFQLRILRKENSTRWQLRAFILLAASFIVMLLGSAIMTHRGQSHQLDSLASQIKDFQTQAQDVRTAIEAIEQEQQVSNALHSHEQGIVSLLTVWEEVSRLLPDHSWIQEFRFMKPQGGTGYQLTLSGLSASAAKLVEVLDHSPRLTNVRLTAPISVDPVEKRERFVLEAEIIPDKPWQKQ